MTINEIQIMDSRTHKLVTVPVPFVASQTDLRGDVRAYIGMNWMTVTNIVSVTVADRPHSWPKTCPVAQVLVDNNGGEPFATEVDVTRGFMSFVSDTKKEISKEAERFENPNIQLGVNFFD